MHLRDLKHGTTKTKERWLQPTCSIRLTPILQSSLYIHWLYKQVCQPLPNVAMYTCVSIWTIKYLWLFTNYTSFINLSNIFHNCWIKNLFEWCWDPIKQNNGNIPRLKEWLGKRPGADFEPDRSTAVVTSVVLMQGRMAAGMCHLVTSISSSEASGRGVRCRHFFQATKLLQVLVKCLPQEGKAMLFFVLSFPCDAQF